MFRSAGILALAAFCFLGGCAVEKKPLPPGEKALRMFAFEGVKLGDRPSALKRFADVGTVPAVLVRDPRIVIKEIPDPNPHISQAAAYFYQDRLYKLELRYFDGEGVRTLSQAGGWQGLRDYLLKRFGPPTQTGTAAPVVTDQGLNAAHAKANLQWHFPKSARRLNFTAMSDDKGGIATVTFTDLAALAQLQAPAHPAAPRQSGSSAPVLPPGSPGF